MTPKLIKQAYLHFEDDKSDKVLIVSLFKNDDCLVEWGRASAENLQSKLFEGAGIDFYDKKIASKVKKGYELVEEETNEETELDAN